MINILRIIKFALQGFFRNFWLSVVTVTMMLMAVFSITLLFGMNYVKDTTIKTVENQVDILIEIKKGITREQVENFVADLEGLEEIKDISIITPEQNRDLFIANNKDKKVQEVLDIYTDEENPFSYSLAVKAYKLSQYSNIIGFLNNEKYSNMVETSDIDTHEEVINTVNRAADFINKYSWYLAGIFLLISIVVIFNTIRISIYTRRDEIMIMKLVGASNWFIRAPFVVESIFYALVAVVIVLLLIFPLVNFIQPYFNNYFQGTQVIDLIGYFKNNFISIFVYQFVVLAVLNILSTAVAIRRYLRV